MRRWKPYYVLDLAKSSALPAGWQTQVVRVVQRYGIDTVLSGKGSTSREAKRYAEIHVRVADGCVVKRELPWLWNLYNGALKDFCARSFGKPMYTAKLLHTTININQLAGLGARYEWHVDSNTVTGVLFATDSAKGLGGSLVFRHKSGHRAIVRPKAGTFICFDAREIEHRVSPLRRDGIRISLPMNFYESPSDQPRPPDLDQQIYTPAGQR